MLKIVAPLKFQNFIIPKLFSFYFILYVWLNNQKIGEHVQKAKQIEQGWMRYKAEEIGHAQPWTTQNPRFFAKPHASSLKPNSFPHPKIFLYFECERPIQN